MENCLTIGEILLYIAIGFVGSFFASGLVMIYSEKRFNRAISATETNIVNAINSLRTAASAIANQVRFLQPLNRTVATIANEIKTLAQVVDTLRKGLEKKK